LRVLQIINSLGYGGAEKLLFDLVILLKNKYNVYSDILVLEKREKSRIGAFLEEGIDVFCLNGKQKSLKNIPKIRKIIKEGSYDIIHSHLFPSNLWLSMIKFFYFLDTPIVTTEHSTYNRRRKIKVLKLIDYLMYKQYERIICISNSTKENLNKYLKSTKENSVVIYNGVNLEVYSDAKGYKKSEIDVKIDSEDILLVMVSSFSDQKDHETVLRSLKLLPKKYKLVFVGDGKNRERIEHLIKDLDLTKRVFLLGTRKDVPNLLKTSDILIQSSIWEGFGLTVVEGMAAGLPVLCSDVPGLNEVINNNKYRFKNEKELAKKVLRITTSTIEKEKALVFFKKRKIIFSAEKMVDNIFKLYKVHQYQTSNMKKGPL